MKYWTIGFPVCPLISIPVITVTLMLFFCQHSRGQVLASQFGRSSGIEGISSVTAQLDQSKLINSGYTTFLGYSLSGNFNQAALEISDTEGKVLRRFSIESDMNGSVILPAHFLPEGSYQLKLMVDGKMQDTHSIRVVR